MSLRRIAYEGSPYVVRRLVGGALARVIPPRSLFGSAYAECAATLVEAEGWTTNQVEQYQTDQLRRVLQHAYEQVDYYRVAMDAVGLEPRAVHSTKDVQALPLLTRDAVERLGTDLIPLDSPPRTYRYVTTGGTSGRPMGFYVGYRASERELAHIHHQWSRAGYRPTSRRAVLRGRAVLAESRGRYSEYDALNRALYLSAFHMTASHMDEYLHAIAKYRCRYLHAYPSTALALAQHVETNATPSPRFKGILLGSENIHQAQRDYIEGVFGCRTFSWYGHSEKCVLAAECESSRDYHVSAPYGLVELVDEAGQAIEGPGVRGFVVGTSFINDGTAFIRYLTDDTAEWAPGSCECGREIPRLRNVRGRWDSEVLTGLSGQQIPIAAVNLHSRAYTTAAAIQFVQHEKGRAKVLVVPTPAFDQEAASSLLEQLHEKFGIEMEFSIERVDEVVRTAAGKTPWVVHSGSQSNT